jgi:glycosyltransferase involved in cell wall biosynthesis
VTADLLPSEEPRRFVHYLTAIKHSSRVAAISASARLEFAGFAYALPTQGLAGPQVFECLLPISKLEHTGAAAAATDSGLPLVLCVGSHEPRKNHLAVLYAAERLWREGLQFELLLIGGSGWGTRLAERAAYLEAQGRPISIVRKAPIADLAAAYERARFTVFPSLHEGYGLPVAESMAHGTPVITANFGSMGELLRNGGGLAIDTRDDEAVVAAMRSLLTDDALLARLRSELTRLPKRSWDDYARELWENLVRPELAAMSEPPAARTESTPAAGLTVAGAPGLT